MVLIYIIILIIIWRLVLAPNRKKPKLQIKVSNYSQINSSRSYSIKETMYDDTLWPNGEEEEMNFLEDNAADIGAIKEWFYSLKRSGYRFSDKAYARAMHVIEGRKWLSDEELEAKKKRAVAWEEKKRTDEILIGSSIKTIINILLSKNMTDEEQSEQIAETLKPLNRRHRIYKGIIELAYWHAMNIIIHSPEIDADISDKAKKRRYRIMRKYREGELLEYPLHEVKSFVPEAIVLGWAQSPTYNFHYIPGKTVL